MRRVPEGLPIRRLAMPVDCLAVPEGLLRRKAGAIGHIAMGIARDGVLLAGPDAGREAWTQPLREAPRMQPEEYGLLMRNAATRMRYAADSITEIGAGDWEDNAAACNRFAANSADAAEFLAKAMLGREGVAFRRTHSLSVLAGRPRMRAWRTWPGRSAR